MRNTLIHWFTVSAFFFGFALASTRDASAQATVVAQRGAEIAPFAQATLVRPDYGSQYDNGFMFGVDYTRFIRSIVQPSLEIRFTDATGQNVNETSFTGGLKLSTSNAFFGVRPYATLLGGTGNITFVHPQPGYPSDSSFVYAMGGGAEVNVLPSWKIRADFVQQHWNLNPLILTPGVFSVGVAYRIPFHGGGFDR
jgi:hypothetical protein